MDEMLGPSAGTADQPVVIPIEAYISPDYARAENDKLWPKVWQAACREEEIPTVGDYVTYDILDESIIIVRAATDRVAAYYNVCQHRGRRLTEGCGHTRQFVCRFHGWRWGLDGENSFVLDPKDWGQSLTREKLCLKTVKLDTWGGWVWINMDPDSPPLEDYLNPAFSMLEPYELGKMRYRWRKWLYLPCNWKTALEAFTESYHAEATHPQLTKWGSATYWCRTENNCAWHGLSGSRDGQDLGGGSGMGCIMARPGQDPRKAAADLHNELLSTLDTATTQTLVNAANRLMDELPAGLSSDEVGLHYLTSAEQDDAARGVIWPKIDPAHMQAVGAVWHIFPNTIVLPGLTFALCYRARPHGFDPNSCIFEVYALERFPEGEEPKTEWVNEPQPTPEAWRKVLSQDFANMTQVQKGMKSRGFSGARPNPVQEVGVVHFHRLLARYIGVGAPITCG